MPDGLLKVPASAILIHQSPPILAKLLKIRED